MKQGFTLIELLVVVLIIGILSAIALPQYEKAVDKAHGTEAVMASKTITDAANLFFLERRTYPTSMSQLSVKVDELQNFSVSFALEGTTFSVNIASTKGPAVTLTTESTRGKMTARYCTGGEDCTNYFSCKINGSKCEFNSTSK